MRIMHHNTMILVLWNQTVFFEEKKFIFFRQSIIETIQQVGTQASHGTYRVV